MRDERSDRAGDERDSIDEDAGSDDATVVVSSDDFVVGALARLPGGLRRLADRVDQHRAVVREVGIGVFGTELRDEMREIELIAAGIVRALDRMGRGRS